MKEKLLIAMAVVKAEGWFLDASQILREKNLLPQRYIRDPMYFGSDWYKSFRKTTNYCHTNKIVSVSKEYIYKVERRDPILYLECTLLLM